jgi:hypothetical protein
MISQVFLAFQSSSFVGAICNFDRADLLPIIAESKVFDFFINPHQLVFSPGLIFDDH